MCDFTYDVCPEKTLFLEGHAKVGHLNRFSVTLQFQNIQHVVRLAACSFGIFLSNPFCPFHHLQHVERLAVCSFGSFLSPLSVHLTTSNISREKPYVQSGAFYPPVRVKHQQREGRGRRLRFVGFLG